MKIIETSTAPNPRRVRIFLAEKGLRVPFEDTGMMAGELRDDAFTRLNPWQRVPILVLDDGTVIAESIAICRYFEVLHPEPALFGRGPLGQATTEMWQRRVELGLFAHIAHAFRHTNPKMAHLEVPQVADWGSANRSKALEAMQMLDRRLAEARHLAGDDYSVADITLLVALDFLKPARIERPAGLVNLARWYAEVKARPSAAA